MKIKCFGIARDIFGCDEIDIDYGEITTVENLRAHLNASNEKLRSVKSYFIAVNQEYANDDQIIDHTDEIAIIPPVSGG